MQQPAMPENHSKASGAGTSIIGILEVCESDFATNLAKEETEEADSASDYEKMTQENALTSLSLIPASAKAVMDAFLQRDPDEGLAVSAPQASSYENR
eukprot:16436332-Heterocapsa_arctica.AAC.1